MQSNCRKVCKNFLFCQSRIQWQKLSDKSLTIAQKEVCVRTKNVLEISLFWREVSSKPRDIRWLWLWVFIIPNLHAIFKEKKLDVSQMWLQSLLRSKLYIRRSPFRAAELHSKLFRCPLYLSWRRLLSHAGIPFYLMATTPFKMGSRDHLLNSSPACYTSSQHHALPPHNQTLWSSC